MLSKAWDSVTPMTITNCFRHAKLSTIPITNKRDEDTHFKDMESVLPMVNPDLTASDFVHIDDDLVTTETLSDKAIALSSEPQSDENVEEESDEEFGEMPTISEARTAMNILRKYLIGTSIAELTDTQQALKVVDSALDRK